MKSQPALCSIFAFALVVAGLAYAPPAHAEREDGGATHLSLDLDLALIERPDHGVDSGGGFAVRLGRELSAVLVSLTPEIVGSHHGFGGGLSPSVTRGLVGARLSFGKILEPGVYAHVGGGRLAYVDDSHFGLAWDGGVSLDLTVLPLVDLGVHGGYSRVGGSGAAPELGWYTVGVHGGLVF